MSRSVATSELHPHDLFELPNGSVYEVNPYGTGATARLWCAHPPDAPIADPPLINLPTMPTVRLLSRHDQGAHTRHAGYVRQVFEQDMDRRHNVRMQGMYERQAQAAVTTRQHAPARRRWWTKLFA
jgi:hypothetical protein